jgi:hypothetical protein
VYLSSMCGGKDTSRSDLFRTALSDTDLETYGGGLFGGTNPTLL